MAQSGSRTVVAVGADAGWPDLVVLLDLVVSDTPRCGGDLGR